jgi:hypothetical protein
LDDRSHGDEVVDGDVRDLDFAVDGGVLLFEVADEQIDHIGDGGLGEAL